MAGQIRRVLWAFLVISLSVILAQDPTDINWLEAAPGVAMEYKVHVDAGKEDCYFQFVHAGATLYVSYQVIT